MVTIEHDADIVVSNLCDDPAGVLNNTQVVVRYIAVVYRLYEHTNTMRRRLLARVLEVADIGGIRLLVAGCPACHDMDVSAPYSHRVRDSFVDERARLVFAAGTALNPNSPASLSPSRVLSPNMGSPAFQCGAHLAHVYIVRPVAFHRRKPAPAAACMPSHNDNSCHKNRGWPRIVAEETLVVFM